MDKEVVSRALGGLEKILSKAKRALRDIEFEQFGGALCANIAETLSYL